jgi:hypothetical protein
MDLDLALGLSGSGYLRFLFVVDRLGGDTRSSISPCEGLNECLVDRAHSVTAVGTNLKRDVNERRLISCSKTTARTRLWQTWCYLVKGGKY